MTGRFPGSLAFGCLVIGLGNLTAIHQVPKSDVASRRTQNFFIIYIIKQRKPSKCVSNKLYLQRGWQAVLCLQKMETDDRGRDG